MFQGARFHYPVASLDGSLYRSFARLATLAATIEAQLALPTFLFCIPLACWLSWPSIMIELEVYAAGVRDLNKILGLDHQLEAVPGLRHKVDSNHDIIYLELDEPTITFREIRSIFFRLGLEPHFVGAIPPELRPRSKTQLLGA
jgi:hypothetical protein